MSNTEPLSSRRQSLFNAILADHRDEVSMNGDTLRKLTVPARHPVTIAAINRLRDRGMSAPVADDPARLIRTFEDYLLGQKNEKLMSVGFGRQIPKGVHYIRSERRLFFDFRNSDLLMEDLEDAGMDLTAALTGADFGCSTGRTIRTLAVGLPHMNWIGLDPVPSSIEYAAGRFPKQRWVVNNQNPPMPLDDSSVDFFVSKSVWTHFSAEAARAWMRDIERVLKPGGYAAITVHGWHDLSRRVVYNDPNPRYDRLVDGKNIPKIEFLELVADELRRDGFMFRPYRNLGWQGDLARIEGATTDNWGLTFITKAWAENNLASAKLSLVRRSIGRTGHRHDILVFKKAA